MSIGQRIRTAREAAGLRQAEVARRAAMMPQEICDLEADRRPDPRLSTLERLAAAIGCDLAALTG